MSNAFNELTPAQAERLYLLVEECNEVIHTHFDCPSCREIYAGTTIWGTAADYVGIVFECESCRAKFRLISDTVEGQAQDDNGFYMEIEPQ